MGQTHREELRNSRSARNRRSKLSPSEFRNVTLAALDRIVDYDNRAILTASILDNTEFLSPYINNIFQKAGIYHLIAISGLHTVILTGALFFFLQLFRLNRTLTGVSS